MTWSQGVKLQRVFCAVVTGVRDPLVSKPYYLSEYYGDRRGNKDDDLLRYRSKRGHKNDDDVLIYDVDEDNQDFLNDSPDSVVDSPGYGLRDSADYDHEDNNILRDTFNDLLKKAHQDRIVKDPDPFHLDLYRLKVAKKPLLGNRKLTKTEKSQLRRMDSNFSRIQMLEKRLKQIEEMKQTLKEKIKKLQKIKQVEHNAKIKMENEVAQAERLWKNDVDRLIPSSFI